MSTFDGLLIFLVVLFGYFLAVYILHKKGTLKRFNISFYGPGLLLRTKKGLGFLSRISRHNRFWKAFGSFGVVFCFIVMFLMTFVLILQAWTVIGFTPEQKQALPGPEFALVLPGINPILPLEYIGYILLALVVAIVVHEFSHGILTFAGKLKVKSLGILYIVVPVGAFCEPDEEQLKKTTIPKRMRVYAAGPLANFTVVLITIVLFSFVFMSSVQPAADGICVFEMYEDSPAYDVGVRTGAIVTSVDGHDLSQYDGLSNRVDKYKEIMNNTEVNQTIMITYIYNKESFTKQIKLADRNQYFQSSDSVGKGFTGIYSFIDVEGNLNVLKNPIFENMPGNFLYFYIIPLMGYMQGYNPISAPFTSSYIITGPFSVLPAEVFWVIVNALYWIFWLNFAVGLFNVLPMIPLDGGFLFNDAVSSIIKHSKKDLSEEKRAKITKNVSTMVSLTILLLVFFPFIIKYL